MNLNTMMISMSLILFLVSCAVPDPYRKRDIEVNGKGIVVAAESVVPGIRVSPNHAVDPVFLFKEILFVSLNRKYDVVPGEHMDTLVDEYFGKGHSRVEVVKKSGDKVFMVHPDVDIRVGDCIDFLTVDGEKTVAYSTKCDPELSAHINE